jgi:hypothetical protein
MQNCITIQTCAIVCTLNASYYLFVSSKLLILEYMHIEDNRNETIKVRPHEKRLRAKPRRINAGRSVFSLTSKLIQFCRRGIQVAIQ